MIFLDTSAVYAMADTDDKDHEEALRLFEAAQRADEEIVTHGYVLVESAALLQRRLGLKTALDFLDDAVNFTMAWVDGELHTRAVEYLRQARQADLSLVDAVSFVVMREMNTSRYLGFDGHFDAAGFCRYAPP